MLSNDATRAGTPAAADTSGVRPVLPPFVQPWLVGLAAAGLVLGLLALAAGGQKRKKRASIKHRFAPKPTGEAGSNGSHRAWYRDQPTPARGAGSAPHSNHADVGQQPSDHRYSGEYGRRIETQYP